MRPRADEAINQLASQWWKGADPGRPVKVTVELSVPTHRSGQEVLDLFAEIVSALSGGYAHNVYVEDD